MAKAYFDPESLEALVEVFFEAKRLLQRRGFVDQVTLDWIARRILNLADQGLPPRAILAEVLPLMTPEAAGLLAASGEVSLRDLPLAGDRAPFDKVLQ